MVVLVIDAVASSDWYEVSRYFCPQMHAWLQVKLFLDSFSVANAKCNQNRLIILFVSTKDDHQNIMYFQIDHNKDEL